MFKSCAYLERWAYDSLRRDDTVSANTNVGQVPTNDSLRLNNVLSVQNDILTATQHRLPTDTIARCLSKKTLLMFKSLQ